MRLQRGRNRRPSKNAKRCQKSKLPKRRKSPCARFRKVHSLRALQRLRSDEQKKSSQLLPRSGTGSEPALREWSAPPQALRRKREAALRAMPGDRLECVIRTGRMKLARASHEWREERDIATNQQQKQENARCAANADLVTRARASVRSPSSRCCQPVGQPREQLQQLFGDRAKILRGRRAARMNHNVPSRGNLPEGALLRFRGGDGVSDCARPLYPEPF